MGQSRFPNYFERNLKVPQSTELAQAFGRIKVAENLREVAEVFQTDILKQCVQLYFVV